MDKTLVLFSHSESSVFEKICGQPMVKDGAARLFHFHAGLDGTKDAAKKITPIRMKAVVDEERMKFSITSTIKLMNDPDTAVFISGRNKRVYQALKAVILLVHCGFANVAIFQKGVMVLLTNSVVVVSTILPFSSHISMDSNS